MQCRKKWKSEGKVSFELAFWLVCSIASCFRAVVDRKDHLQPNLKLKRKSKKKLRLQLERKKRFEMLFCNLKTWYVALWCDPANAVSLLSQWLSFYTLTLLMKQIFPVSWLVGQSRSQEYERQVPSFLHKCWGRDLTYMQDHI